jgi:hypothetical protein
MWRNFGKSNTAAAGALPGFSSDWFGRRVSRAIHAWCPAEASTSLNSRELDANIVLVKVDGKDMFFDPGAEFTPFGMLPWMETNVVGLRLDKDGGKWIFTTLPESNASRVEHKGDLKLLEDGSLAGKVTVTWTGLAAMRRRVEERNEDDANRKKLLEDEVRESIA